MGARDGGDAMTSCCCPTKTLETSPLDCVVPAMEDGEWRLGRSQNWTNGWSLSSREL